MLGIPSEGYLFFFEDVLKRIAALNLKPDYLPADTVMPGMNGVDLAIRVRNQLPATVIVLISGQAGITDLLRQAKDGCQSSVSSRSPSIRKSSWNT